MNNRSELVPFSVIIPAAGYSGRMGSDKALLDLGDGQTFASHLVASYSASGARPVVIIMNERQTKFDVNSNHLIWVTNRHVERGRSHSVFLGIREIPEGCACFVQNIDNPFFDKGLLEQMVEMADSDGFVVPVWNGMGGHPVLLGQNIVSYIKGLEDLHDFREVLRKFRRNALPFPDERILWNINTPGEYQKFLGNI